MALNRDVSPVEAGLGFVLEDSGNTHDSSLNDFCTESYSEFLAVSVKRQASAWEVTSAYHEAAEPVFPKDFQRKPQK